LVFRRQKMVGGVTIGNVVCRFAALSCNIRTNTKRAAPC
jgi:hypothetical protein